MEKKSEKIARVLNFFEKHADFFFSQGETAAIEMLGALKNIVALAAAAIPLFFLVFKDMFKAHTQFGAFSGRSLQGRYGGPNWGQMVNTPHVCF